MPRRAAVAGSIPLALLDKRRSGYPSGGRAHRRALRDDLLAMFTIG
jgi:hypothetical protein